MANTVTGLIPTLYGDAQTVAREMQGFIGAVDSRFDDKGASYLQTVSVPVTPSMATTDFTPAQTITVGTDRTEGKVDITFAASKKVTWHMSDSEMETFASGGDIAATLFRQKVQQAMRSISNGIETGIGAAIYKEASRAVGTAGTTPFAANFEVLADLLKVFKDNGSPGMDLSLVMGTSAGANLRKLTQLTNVNQAGSDDTLRNGNLLNIHGFALRESAGVASHTAGTGAAYEINGAVAVGATAVDADTGTGTILAGDVITSAGWLNDYVVNTALAGGSLAIGKPGAREIFADNDVVTLAANYTANVALWRNAVVLLVRPPAINDTPIQKTYKISDPVSGLTFLMVEAPGYGLTTYELHAAYGYKVVQSEFVNLLLG